MIEKMAYVNITGPKGEFDKVTDEYLSDYEIQLENAVLELNSPENVSPFLEANPYKELIQKAGELTGSNRTSIAADAKSSKKAAKEAKKLERKLAGQDIGRDEACALISGLYDQLADNRKQTAALEKEKAALEAELESVAPFKGLNYKLEDILAFKNIRYHFGRLPKDAWGHFAEYADPDVASLFTKCTTDKNYVWGVYFCPAEEDLKVSTVYTSLRFESMNVCSKYQGTPNEICDQIEHKIHETEQKMADVNAASDALLSEHSDALYLAKQKLEALSYNFDARKLAATTKLEQSAANGVDTSFFIICGWMRAADAKQLDKRITEDLPDVVFLTDNDPERSGMTPPTSIKNKGIFKPYEMYVKMYGLPAYNEFDPTILVSLLYSFLFGAMFGDLGHGLVLLIGGLALYLVKKAPLAGIIAFAGFFSSIFGILFGSLFGFEDIIPAVWLRPAQAMSELNFVGRLNTVFALAVAFGMILMLVLIVINVINHIKQKDLVSAVFTSNGIIGFIFYGTLVVVVFLYMLNKPLPPAGLIVAVVVISLLLMAVDEPFVNRMKHRKALETSVGMFCVQSFFDLFETCLSYFSNTISFVRVGAFAVSHAAMMEVVLSLTGYANGGSGSIIGLILGNIVVIGFEGLIVGIQVLRLQYYEIFSKFYKGDGKEFKPFFKKRRNS